MPRFGGNEFTSFSVPLTFEGRYFILEPGEPPLVSVILAHGDKLVFEVLRNEPGETPISDVSKTAAGVVTVSDKESGRFLYKVRPRYETSVVFGKLGGGELAARVTDRSIEVAGMTVTNNRFSGPMVGVAVGSDGSVGIGALIPPVLQEWFGS